MWNEPTKSQLSKIPKLYSQDGKGGETIIYEHFFLAGCDWFIAEYDGEDTFFGFAILNRDYHNAEWGYLSFQDLKDLKVNQPVTDGIQKIVVPLEVDRDINWKPTKVKDIPIIVKCGGIFNS
jgi:hypothetical protein